jgi:hypothetical protein
MSTDYGSATLNLASTAAIGGGQPVQPFIGTGAGVGGGSAASDGVVFLCHADGVDGVYGPFVDVKGHAVTSTAIRYSAPGKFGGTGLLFTAGNSGLNITDAPDLTLAGDFTIEFWLKMPTPSSEDQYVVSLADYKVLRGQFATALKLCQGGSDPGTTRITTNAGGLSNDSAWNHVAWVRSAGVHRLYVDGVTTGGVWGDAASYDPSVVSFGKAQYTSVGKMTGSMDEIRITNGSAQYTSNFTPPAVVFPDPASGVANVMKNGHIGSGVIQVVPNVIGAGYIATPGTKGITPDNAVMIWCSCAAGCAANAAGTITAGVFVPGAGSSTAMAAIPAGQVGWVKS